jgi:hypothetical protein
MLGGNYAIAVYMSVTAQKVLLGVRCILLFPVISGELREQFNPISKSSSCLQCGLFYIWTIEHKEYRALNSFNKERIWQILTKINACHYYFINLMNGIG